jgi:flagellar hook protein FlgE
MRRIWMFSLVFISCLSSFCFASQSFYHFSSANITYHTTSSNSSRLLDLSNLLGNHLSLAVKNPDTGVMSYTHDGKLLKKDKYFYQGNNRLQGYPIPTDLTSNDCKLIDIKTPENVMKPEATSIVVTNGLNLDANSTPISVPFDPNNGSSFNIYFISKIIDAQGNNHDLSLYFAKSSTQLAWTVHVLVDKVEVGTGEAIFTTNGALDSVTGLTGLPFNLESGATSQQVFEVNLTGATQFAGNFTYPSVVNNGLYKGEAFAEGVDDNGYIFEEYTNGRVVAFAKIAVFIG